MCVCVCVCIGYKVIHKYHLMYFRYLTILFLDYISVKLRGKSILLLLPMIGVSGKVKTKEQILCETFAWNKGGASGKETAC